MKKITKNKMVLMALGVVMMGNVTELWGGILERSVGKVQGDHVVQVVDTIKDNCGVPIWSYRTGWNIANGCVRWIGKNVQSIEVR